MSIYTENIEFLQAKFPRLLELLGSVPGGRCRTEPAKNGSLTLVYTHNNTPFYLHSRFNPEDESAKILQNKDLSADHIVVLGLGLGYHLEKIMAGKDPLSRVLLVEPEIELVRHSLNTVRWNKWLNRKDFFYVLGNDLGQLAETLHIFFSVAIFEKVEYIELPSETRLMPAFFSKARETLDTEIKTHIYDFKTRLAESYMVPRNILRNLYWVLKSRPIIHLRNYFAGWPGFIVSAGPSLDRNVLHLKGIRDRGVLIAVDTAVKPLLKRSIQPQFTAIGDPSHKNYLHLQGVEEELQYFIAAEPGIAHQVYKDFQDRIFSLSIGKPIVRILESHSEPLGEIEAWGSVISIALDFAVYIGLNPIIFVGQDFAYTDTRNHCRGTSWEEKESEYTQNLDDLQRFESQSITGNRKISETLDIYGNKTFTSERLQLYKNYLARLVKKHPEVRFINATEGGIFSEIPHMSLRQAVKEFTYGKKTIDFTRIYHIPTLNKRENIDRLLIFLKQTREFFENYLAAINDILVFFEKNENFSPEMAAVVLPQLDLRKQEVYKVPEHGEILEMWSSLPIYNLLKESKRIRNLPLDEATIRENYKIYHTYFRDIKPLVEDIIKRFMLTAEQLEELESSSSQGGLLIRLREGAVCPLSMRNPYLFEAVKLKGLLYTLPELEHEFPAIFENPALPLVLEVGCYFGHTVKEWAVNNPGFNILGTDIKYKRVVKSCRKIKKAGLTNAKIALCDVMELLPMLPVHSLYGMLVFFPDPWGKSKHEKYRYLNENFFIMASTRLMPGGFIWIKTDHKNYFDEIMAAAGQYGFRVQDRLPGEIAPRQYRTQFEDIFTRKGIPYYQVILIV